jgi:hypothetical protein
MRPACPGVGISAILRRSGYISLEQALYPKTMEPEIATKHPALSAHYVICANA